MKREAMEERLQKLISRGGVASRRKAEELIRQGAVTVNGKIVTELGTKADPGKDSIKVRGKLLFGAPRDTLYIALNKPRGFITSTEDPEGRRTVMDLLGRYRHKVYPVGRLDFHSEGLLLLTNDGDFANKILSAKSAIPKTYQVKASQELTPVQMDQFRKGIAIDGRKTAPAKLRLMRAGKSPWYEITLIEGRNRQIRRMFQRLGVLVEKIKRVRIGPLALGNLPAGVFRQLTPREIERLRHAWEGGGTDE